MPSEKLAGRLVDRPLAVAGLASYRCRGRYGWIMIGAKDHDDALSEARRSCAAASREDLELWDGGQYVPVVTAAAREVTHAHVS